MQPSLQHALVLRVDAKVCHVEIDGATQQLPLAGKLFETKTREKQPLAVGDLVLLDPTGRCAFYLLIGLFGATVGSLFLAFPKELILAIAGLALLGTIGSGLAAALGNESEREPALLTFLVTASGIALAGIGSAFWGLLVGLAALLVLRTKPQRP